MYKVVLLLHGYRGSKKDLLRIEEHLLEEGYLVICHSYNYSTIQEWGQHVIKHVKTFFESLLEKHNQDETTEGDTAKSSTITVLFSLIGHSLGGIVGRYVLPDLFEYWETLSDRVCVIPQQYMSIASPHLGVQRSGGSLMKNMWKGVVSTVVHTRIGGNIPYQLHFEEEPLSEKDITQPHLPKILLLQMCFGKFIDALLKFQARTLVAVPHYDFSVPFPSASIRFYNPYPIPQPSNFRVEVCGMITPEKFKERERDKVETPYRLRQLHGAGDMVYDKELSHKCEKNPKNEMRYDMGNKSEMNDSETIQEDLHNDADIVQETSLLNDGSHQQNTKELRWIVDNYQHLRIPELACLQLQSIPWHRLDIQFHSSAVSRFTSPYHVMVVGTSPFWNPFGNGPHACMQECVNAIFEHFHHQEDLITSSMLTEKADA